MKNIYKKLTPSDSTRNFLLLALSFDDKDDPRRKKLWRTLFKRAKIIASKYHKSGRTLIDESDIINSWIMHLEADTSIPQILLDDLHCGFKTLSQEFDDAGLTCIASADHERFGDDYHEAVYRTPEQIIEDSHDPDYYQESAEVCNRTEYPFLGGMYDNTLPEPWQGYDYRHISTYARRKYHPRKKSKRYLRNTNQLELVV